ncbi:Cyclin N-terminal domain-containing protein [Citrus sinensis]|nr:Cyclin N-terminal domain-containing protein [Citrus sinensis]
MAPSFDCVVSSLLCAEEDSSVFDDINGSVVDEFENDATWHHGNNRTQHRSRRFDDGGDMLLSLPLQSDECLALLLEKECHHLPHNDYLKRLRTGDLDLAARQEAVDWIAKVHSHFGFGPLCSYLTINYLDRFLSAYELPKGKVWMMQLLAVACLSLAAKMEETEVPLCLDLQVGQSKFLFEAKTIQRMELLVLSTLKWRMQAITPFSFLDYFTRKITDDDDDHHQTPLRALFWIDFLEFKPSEIAAAVAISVTGETKTVVDTEKAISLLTQHVKKERVLKCIKMMNDSLISGSVKSATSASLATSFPQSPIGVLDAACLSYKSDESTVGSCANSSHNTPDNKRRKLNTPYEVEL